MVDSSRCGIYTEKFLGESSLKSILQSNAVSIKPNKILAEVHKFFAVDPMLLLLSCASHWLDPNISNMQSGHVIS